MPNAPVPTASNAGPEGTDDLDTLLLQNLALNAKNTVDRLIEGACCVQCGTVLERVVDGPAEAKEATKEADKQCASLELYDCHVCANEDAGGEAGSAGSAARRVRTRGKASSRVTGEELDAIVEEVTKMQDRSMQLMCAGRHLEALNMLEEVGKNCFQAADTSVETGRAKRGNGAGAARRTAARRRQLAVKAKLHHMHSAVLNNLSMTVRCAQAVADWSKAGRLQRQVVSLMTVVYVLYTLTYLDIPWHGILISHLHAHAHAPVSWVCSHACLPATLASVE